MKILVWGTGKIAENIIEGLEENQVIGYVESKKSREIYRGKRVYDASEIPSEYDVILIANQHGREIYNYCSKFGIEVDKLCFLMPIPQKMNVENNICIAKKILKRAWYEKVCAEFGRIEDDWIVKDAILYSKLNKHPAMIIKEEYNMPVYTDKVAKAGSIHSYFWQDLWAARKIYKESPETHYDIGSRVDGFVAHLLTFRDNVNLIDIRPLDRPVDGLKFTCADATNLNDFKDESIESLSALCSLEHFGLGRYGDKIDPDACYKCFEAIRRKIKKGGNIYLSVPVGREHLEFNAHRVFYASTIVEAFSEFELIEYSCTHNGYIEYNVDLHKYDNDISLGGKRFGLFHLRRLEKKDE